MGQTEENKKREKNEFSSGLAGTLRILSWIDRINHTTTTGLAKITECQNYGAAGLARQCGHVS